VAGLDGLLRSLELLLDGGLELRELGRETLERYREINLLYHIGETIGACLDPSEIPCLVLDDAHEVLRAETGAVLLSSPSGKPELKVQECLGTASQVQALMEVSSALVEQVFQSGEPDLWSESDPAKMSTPPVGTILCAPLKTQGRSLGVVVLGRPVGAPPFTASDQKLAMALAGQAGIAIERAGLHKQELERQRMEEELALGQQIQLSLLPEACPGLAGWEFAAYYQAARQVGGDFYDFIPLPGGRGSLGVVVADVTGKGVPAALMVAATRSMLRAESRRDPLLTPSPRVVLEQASQELYADNPARLFLTAFFAVLEPNNGRVVYANGGHEYPLWLRSATGECQPLSARSTLLGAFPSIELEERQVELASGDLLVFYTDGVTEAREARGAMYGEDRLRSVVASCAGTQADQALKRLYRREILLG
jgi:sigma-B regulation protein RsbU (phosphoserine phosphatase)